MEALFLITPLPESLARQDPQTMAPGLSQYLVPQDDTIGQSGDIGKCDMDIEGIGVTCGACVTEVLVATGELSDPDVEYVIGIPMCRL